MASVTTEANGRNYEEWKLLCEKGREKLSSWLDQFGWSREGLESKFGHLAIENGEAPAYLACPFESGHRRIARENYERHVNRCRLKHENYDRDDIVRYRVNFTVKILTWTP